MDRYLDHRICRVRRLLSSNDPIETAPGQMTGLYPPSSLGQFR